MTPKIQIGNVCNGLIISAAYKQQHVGPITPEFLDTLVQEMQHQMNRHGINVYSNDRLREHAVDVILREHGTKAFGVDNGIS